MQSKTSFFNFAVFKNNIARMWPVWAVYLAILIMMFPATMATEMNYSYYDMQTPIDIAKDLMQTVTYAGLPLLAAGFGIVSAMALFNYLYTTKSAGMIGSFPITRRALFFTNYMSGVAWITGSNLITMLLIMIVEMLGNNLIMGYVLQWFFIFTLQGIFFFSLATFCAALTGNIIMLPAIYGLFNFIFIIFEFLFRTVSQELLIGLTGFASDYSTIPLTPLIKYEEARLITLGTELNPVLKYDSWNWVLGYFIAGIVLVTIAIYLIRYRHMETATDVIAVKWLRPVFKFGAAIGCGMVLGLFVYAIIFEGFYSGGGSALPLGLCMVVFAVIGCYAAEMMLQKSLKVFSNWRDPLIAACAMAFIMCGIAMDFMGLEDYIPHEDEIVYASVSIWGETSTFSSEEGIREVIEFHEEVLKHKDELERSYSIPNEKYTHVRINYRDAGTMLAERSYTIPLYKERNNDESTYQGKLQALVNSEEAIKSRTKIHDLVEYGKYDFNEISWMDENEGWRNQKLSEEEIAYLLEKCVMVDIEEKRLGYIDLMEYDDIRDTYVDLTIYVEATVSEKTYISAHLTVTPTASLTLAYLDSLGITPKVYGIQAEKYAYADTVTSMPNSI